MTVKGDTTNNLKTMNKIKIKTRINLPSLIDFSALFILSKTVFLRLFLNVYVIVYLVEIYLNRLI